jgi:uncharacterized membrane-anchored protein
MTTSRLMPWLRLCVLGLLTALAARAADTPASPSQDQLAALAASLKWQTGTITLKDGLAKITLTPDFRFLDSDDAQKVIHDMWRNPPDPRVLGMIFPKDAGPLDRTGWAVTVSYEESGYVKDDDASKINYDDLLKQMQQQIKESNPEREKEGYAAIDLVGWAQPPRYDAATHKLYWAKELRFANDPSGETLNYDIRILGRRGVLVLSAVAGMDQLAQVYAAMPTILAMVDFQPGNTYAEFDPKIDKVAEYGLAGLIFAGAAAGAVKLGLFAGLFKWIFAAALALKKALIVIVIAIVAGVKKLWSKISGKSSTPRNLLPPNSGGPPQA